MNTTYDVRIWPKISEYTRKKTKKTTYTVRWMVAGHEKRSPHESYALADAFRSELVAASRRTRGQARGQDRRRLDDSPKSQHPPQRFRLRRQASPSRRKPAHPRGG